MSDAPIETGRIEARQIVHDDGTKSSEVHVSEDLPPETAAWLLIQLQAVINHRYIRLEEDE